MRNILIGFFFAISLLFLSVEPSLAFPHFSRQIGRDCTYCHSLLPRLNETGRVFKSNGYRFESEGEWRDVKDISSPPVSFEAEGEVSWDQAKTIGTTDRSSDLKIEEAELMAGAAFGKTGLITALAMIAIAEEESGTETSIHKAFIQVNDLLGRKGAGALNLRAGKWEIGLPFLNTEDAIISNRYLAERTLGVLSQSNDSIEFNGSVLGEEDSWRPTHRYSAGLAKEDVNSPNKLRGYYATYSLTFLEKLNAGLMYRGGKAADGSVDRGFNRLGAALGLDLDRWMFTAGYFRSLRSGASGLEDYLAEAFYTPVSRVGLGARYEQARESGKEIARSHTLMARYRFLNSVFAQFEYRFLNDKGHVVGTNDETTGLRLFLTALF